MKPRTTLLALLLPVAAGAQNTPGMSEADMQKMMQHMQGVPTCMQGIDQSRLQAFEQRARQVEAEVKALCASGKRDAAQQQAIAFAREITANPDMQKMKQCGEKMRGMMPPMPGLDQAGEPDAATGHVCDQ